MKKTPLNSWHHQAGARMVDFSGWEMPVQYQGIIAEHKATRARAGLFDVSHMGEILLTGKDALSNLQRLLPNDPSKLALGQAQYSPLLYDNATVVDDLSVYKLAEEKYLLCVNCSNKDKDFAWVRQNLQGDCLAQDVSDQYGQIALQGPEAVEILQKALGFDLMSLKYWWFTSFTWEGAELLIARMGYTGEKGCEIFCPSGVTRKLWEAILAAGEPCGLVPVGLGARDTLRMEVAYPLYGQELDDRRHVLGANVTRFLKLDKPQDFIGKQALQAGNNPERLIYLVLEEKGIPRPHYPLLNLAGQRVGEVTSGTYSPSLGQGIAIAYAREEEASQAEYLIEIRGKGLKARRIQPPFYHPSK